MQKHQQLATLTSPCPATHQEAQVKRNSALEWIAMCTRETRGITTCLIFNARYLSTQHARACPLGALYLWLLRLSLGLKNPGNLSNCRVSVQILLLLCLGSLKHLPAGGHLSFHAAQPHQDLLNILQQKSLVRRGVTLQVDLVADLLS